MEKTTDLVGLIAHQMTGAINGNCCHRTGGLVDIPTCECRDAAERILEAFPAIASALSPLPSTGNAESPPPSSQMMGMPALTDDQVEAVIRLVESRLCIIWAKVGAREEFANELRVLEHASDDEEEICEACGEPFEEGDLVYWSSDETGHLHADCCGPERESYVNPDGSPLADGDPIPQPFPYEPPSKTIQRLAATATPETKP